MITALIVAAGKGVRMGGSQRKQYMSVGGRTILEATMNAAEIPEIAAGNTTRNAVVTLRPPSP